MPVMQLYERPVPLHRETHQKIRIKQNGGYEFARTCQTAILTSAELSQATKEFPVVFTKEGDNYLPLALFGLQQNQNLFVDEAGQWTARLIPAFIRRYPFVPAQGQEKDSPMTLWIDEAAECVNREEGEPLFLNGKNSALLDSTLQFLQDFKMQSEVTGLLVKQLADAGLFSEKTAQLQLQDGQFFNLTGFMTVDTEKLAQLSQETVHSLFLSGALCFAYLHLSSLDNWHHLLSLQAKLSMQKAN